MRRTGFRYRLLAVPSRFSALGQVPVCSTRFARLSAALAITGYW